jgi:MFS family permease
MSGATDSLVTPRFLMMCGFSFTVFFSAFQLLPTAPFRIVDLGGSRFAAGLFLGFLTYASAFSAPLTGALSDRFGRRRTLVIASLAIAVFAVAYGMAASYRLMLVIVLVHGVFWSGLLSASSAYTMDLIPPGRRAEGIGYWGVSTTLAVSVAPAVGLWIYRHGWIWLCVSIGLSNLIMAAIAWSLTEDRHTRVASSATPRPRIAASELFEWRVAVVAFTLFLYSFGYGGITSFVAMYAEANGVAPRAFFFTVFAFTVILTRPFLGRLADRLGHVRVFVPCIWLIVLAYLLLAMGGTRFWLLAAGTTFGIGFGSAYPIFAAHVMHHVGSHRRGAAFGGILAALDTGIGSGSIALGWLIERRGFTAAFGTAAVFALLAIPYFRLVERPMLQRLSLKN